MTLELTTGRLVRICLLISLILPGFFLASAAAPFPAPTTAGGWADSWDGMHSFLMYGPHGQLTPQYIASVASRYDFGWSPQYTTVLVANNPSFVAAAYQSATLDSAHDYAWYQANHPDWLLYACDRVTPILHAGTIPALDFTNPAVVDYKFSQANNGSNVAWNNFNLSNDFELANGSYGQACGVYDQNRNWVQKFAGISSYADVLDPQWTDAIIAYAAAIRSRLHALPVPRLLIPNADPKIVAGDPVRSANLIAAVDGLLVTGSNLGPSTAGDSRLIWLRSIRFAEAMNSAGKAFYPLESPSGGTISQSYVQFTLASYFLAKGHTSALNILPPAGAASPDGTYWPPEFQAATVMGVPCAAMSQVAGATGTENGLFMREHSGGVSLVNPSTASSFTATLPGVSSYKDLYGSSVGSLITIPPRTGLVLLKAIPATCSNGVPPGSDTTPPVISSISITNITGSTATVNWNTNEPADAQIQFVTSCPATGCLSGVNSVLTAAHSHNVTGLLANTFYTIQIRSRDAAGNLAVSSNQVFISGGTTPGDTTPPVISAISITSITASTAMVNWSTSEPADGQLQFVAPCPSSGCSSPLDSALTTSHSYSITGLLANTAYTFQIRSRDAAGNLTVSSNQVFTSGGTTPGDTTPPVISAISITSITASTATVIWSTNEPADGQLQFGAACPSTGCSSAIVSALTTSHSYSITGLLANTSYTFQIRSRDGAGNLAVSSNQAFTTALDTTPPVISSISITNVTASTATVTWSTNEPADRQLQFLAACPSSGCSSAINSTLTTSHSYSITGLLANTSYTFQIRSRDAAGNLAVSSNQAFTTAVTPGTLTLRAIPTGILPGGAVTAEWNGIPSPRPTDWLGVYLPGATHTSYLVWMYVNTCSQTPGVSALASGSCPVVVPTSLGTKTFELRLLADNGGVPALLATSNTFTVEATAPVISSIAITSITASMATVTWSTSEPADGQLQFVAPCPSTGCSSAIDSALTTSHIYSITGLLANTSYSFQIRSRDVAGNLAVSSNRVFTTAGDTTPPVISAIAITSSTASTATVSWSTNEPADGQLQFVAPCPSTGCSTAINSALTTPHSFGITGLVANTSYTFQIRSRDGAGNLAVSSNQVFTTAGDATPPVISSIAITSVTASTATVSWSTSEPADGQLQFVAPCPSTGCSTAINSALTTPHSFSITGLLANTSYTFQIRSRDAAGNLAVSSNQVFTTVGDATPPVISAIAITSITASTATVSWSTSEPADGQLQFVTACPSTGCWSAIDSAPTTAHSYSITGLLANTFYTFQIRSRDAAGNLAASSNQVFKTAAATGPTLSLSPTSVLSGGIVTATWSGIAAPTPGDWIGLFVQGSANTSYLAFSYVSCFQTPGSASASGSCPLLVPASLPTGTYELRLLANNGFTALATSSTVAVTGGGVPPPPPAGDSPKGRWGRLTAIADNNHPNLFYNQSEVDELRNMILVQRSPQHLYDLYNTYMKDVFAVSPPSPPTGAYPEYRTNMQAAISYMIEPTSAKADAIRSALFGYLNTFPNALPDWYNNTAKFSGYSLSWLFDLLMAYHPEKISPGEKATLKNWFSASSASRKLNSRDPRLVSQSGTTLPPPTIVREGKSVDPLPNWYSRYMGPALAMALVSGDQNLVDYFGDSGWPHGLLTFNTVTGAFPSDYANRYDLVTYLLGVYPSGANTDTYDRELYATQIYGVPLLPNSLWFTVDYTWGTYHFAQMYGAILGAEMAYHNGMTGVFGITDVPGSEPALLRTYKRAIQSRTEIDSQILNPTTHPIIGWDPAIFAGSRRYTDPAIQNALPGIVGYSGPVPAGVGTALRGLDVPGEVWQFFGYPRRTVQ